MTNPRRPWIDLGDIAYRQGVGNFHVAGEAYKGALQRAGGTFSPDKQVSHRLPILNVWQYRAHKARGSVVTTPNQQHGLQLHRLLPDRLIASIKFSIIAKFVSFKSLNTQGTTVTFVPTCPEQASVMFRIFKCSSRRGDKTGAVAGLERLLYNFNFWDERYRFDGLIPFCDFTLSGLRYSSTLKI